MWWRKTFYLGVVIELAYQLVQVTVVSTGWWTKAGKGACDFIFMTNRKHLVC